MTGRLRGNYATLDPGTLHTTNPERVPRPAGQGDLYGQSRGGVAFKGRVIGRPGRAGEITTVQPPQNTNATLIVRARGGYLRESYYLPPAQGMANWTAAGPARNTLRERNFTWRPIVAAPRYKGLHTNIPIQPRDEAGRQAMRPRRQNRLTVQRFRGQTYSQTTQLQGSAPGWR